MYCYKKEKRNIFSFFKEYECKNCKHYLNDEIIKIGNKEIKIFYLINECAYNNRVIVGKSSKVNLLFKDICIDYMTDIKSNNIFLWFNKGETFNKYYEELNYFLNNDFNIYIII